MAGLKTLMSVAIVGGIACTSHAVGNESGPRAGAVPKPVGLTVLPISGSATISGRIRSTDGHAIGHALVSLIGPERRTAVTDSRGNYSFTLLGVGRYSLTASKAGFSTLELGQIKPNEPSTQISLTSGMHETVSLTLSPAAVVTGRVVDESGLPLSDAVVRLSRHEFEQGRQKTVPAAYIPQGRTNDLGEFRIHSVPPGEYALTASSDLEFFDNSSGKRVSYSVNRGEPDPSREARINVPARGLDAGVVKLVPRALTTISGRAIDSLGRDARSRGGIARITRKGDAAPLKVDQLRPDGTFRLELPLEPGKYTIAVSLAGDNAHGGAAPELGKLDVQFKGTPLDNVVVRTALGGGIQGHVVFANNKGTSQLQGMRVFARPAEFDGSLIGSMSVPVADDGGFLIRNVFERSTLVVDFGPIGGLTVVGVFQNGRLVENLGFAPAPEKLVDGVEIRLGAEPRSGVSGTVMAEPGSKQIVVVFPSDESKWSDERGRYIRAIWTEPGGSFSVTGLPEGVYYCGVLSTLDRGQLTNPLFLRTIRADSTRFEVHTNAIVQLALPRIRPKSH